MAKRKHANMYEDVDWPEYEYRPYPKALVVPEEHRSAPGQQVIVQSKEEHAAQFEAWGLTMPEEPKTQAEVQLKPSLVKTPPLKPS